MKYFVRFPSGGEHVVDVDGPVGAERITVDGRALSLTDLGPRTSDTSELTLKVADAVVHLFTETKMREGELVPDVGAVTRGDRFYAHVESERSKVLAAAAGKKGSASEGLVTSPMPGRVLKVLVAEGDQVEAGKAVVVVEAMKMENEIAAPRAGTVAKVHVAAGVAVEGGAKLVEIV